MSNNRELYILLVSLLFVLVLASCAAGEEKLDEEIEIRVGNEVFRVEVARSDEDRQRGLMGRRELGAREGMLFVFENDRQMSFWMKNTEIPLSIAYISAEGQIREIHELEPLSLRTVESQRALRYALELPRGAFGRAGADVGDYIEFPENW